MDEEALAAALRRCLYLASRSADKRVLAAAAAAYQYLLRVAAGAAGGLGKSEKVRGGWERSDNGGLGGPCLWWELLTNWAGQASQGGVDLPRTALRCALPGME